MSFDLSRAAQATGACAWFECDLVAGTGFEVELHHLSKDAMDRMAKRNRRRGWDKKSHQPTEEVDPEALRRDFVKHVLTGFRGLTVGIARQLLLLDDVQVRSMAKEWVDAAPAGETRDPEDCPIEYNPENAAMLLKHGHDFDIWTTTVATDPARFVGNAGSGDSTPPTPSA